jgi:hypothetical protein
MRSPLQAIVWEIWAANRRSWLVVLAIVPIWGVVCRLFSDNLQHSDAMKGLSFIPTMLTTCLLMSIFNFTETNPRKGFAGFPQRFFTLPIPTWSLVGIPMACGILSVVGLYIVWAEFVFRPAGVEMLIRWPAVLLAGTVVFYQSIIWCLSGFRIIRLLTLGFVMTYAVAIGMIPFLPPNLRGNWTESRLTLILAGLMAGAFCASVISIGNQRRGGIQGWAWRRELVRRLTDAIPHVQWNLNSPSRALLWMEWRRSGLVLPIAVLFALLLIIGPVSWIAGHGPKATLYAVSWIAILPILLALPVSQGLAKPDFWSLELALSPFLSTRPISGSQIIAAKMKSAAISTLITWGLVLTITPLWVYLKCDPEKLRDAWGMFRTLYSPISQWAIPVFTVIAAMLLTWNMLVGSIWRGYSGRTWFFYTMVSISIAVFLASLIFFAWFFDQDEDHGSLFVAWLPWLPWILAGCFIVKCWTAVGALQIAKNGRMVSDRAVIFYLACWAAATVLFMCWACLVSPRVVWLRDLLLFAALLAVPIARTGIALPAIAWNRHR